MFQPCTPPTRSRRPFADAFSLVDMKSSNVGNRGTVAKEFRYSRIKSRCPGPSSDSRTSEHTCKIEISKPVSKDAWKKLGSVEGGTDKSSCHRSLGALVSHDFVNADKVAGACCAVTLRAEAGGACDPFVAGDCWTIVWEPEERNMPPPTRAAGRGWSPFASGCLDCDLEDVATLIEGDAFAAELADDPAEILPFVFEGVSLRVDMGANPSDNAGCILD